MIGRADLMAGFAAVGDSVAHPKTPATTAADSEPYSGSPSGRHRSHTVQLVAVVVAICPLSNSGMKMNLKRREV